MGTTLTLDADMSKPIKQPFACLYWWLTIAPNRLFNVVAAFAAKHERDPEARPGEALLERQSASVTLLAAVSRRRFSRPLPELGHSGTIVAPAAATGTPRRHPFSARVLTD